MLLKEESAPAATLYTTTVKVYCSNFGRATGYPGSFRVFLSPSTQMLGYYDLGHGSFLPNPF
jgi:hypothetical protein